MKKKKRLKQHILDAMRNITLTIDEAIDYVAYPVIERAIVEPLLKVIPEREIEPEQIKDEMKRILMSFVEPARKHKAPLPVALLVLGGILISALPQVFSAFLNPLLQSTIGHGANVLFRPTLLDPQQVLEAYRRGIISDKATRDRLLAYYGLSTMLIDILDKLQWYIPTPPDIIRFGVREVYNEEVAKKFRMDEGFDELVRNAKKDMDAAALSEETMRKYWRAHWELPSAQMGFEMFHRGIISYDELKLLLKTLDIMPFWQDKLIQLSYIVPTRVDLRRMHKLKLISDEELTQYYMKLGYSREDAEKLTKFTIEYNKNPEWTERTLEDEILFEYRNKAKSEIIQAYKTLLIDENTAREQLRAIGLKDEAIEYEIAFAEYDRRREIINDYISVLTSKYVKGLIDEVTLRNKLSELNLPSFYVDHIVTIANIKALDKPQTPSKSDILDWFKKGIIDERTTRNMLSGLGYANEYIDLYIKEIQLEKQRKEAKK